MPVLFFYCSTRRPVRRSGGLYQDREGVGLADNNRASAVFCWPQRAFALGAIVVAADMSTATDWPHWLCPRCSTRAASCAEDRLHDPHLAFPGLFPAAVFPELGLAPEALSPEGIEFYGQVSLFKAGIRLQRRGFLTTVSRPMRARSDDEHACGLEGPAAQSARRSRRHPSTGPFNYGQYGALEGHELASQYTPTSFRQDRVQEAHATGDRANGSIRWRR